MIKVSVGLVPTEGESIPCLFPGSGHLKTRGGKREEEARGRGLYWLRGRGWEKSEVARLLLEAWM